MSIWSKRLGFLLLLLAILYGLTLPAKQILLGYAESNINNLSVSKQDIKQNQEQKTFQNDKTIHPPSFTDSLRAIQIPDAVKKQIIGYVTVPKVGIDLSILSSTTDENLWYGATTFKKTQKMGGMNNYVLFGHHIRRPQALFSPLGKVKLGDIVEITDLNKVYTYRVDQKKTITDTDWQAVQDHKQKEITLITCDTSSSTNKRWVVHGVLQKVTAYQNDNPKSHSSSAKTKHNAGLTQWYIYTGLLFILLILVILSWLYQERKWRKKHATNVEGK
ncbi:class A sortase [Listeria sp. PSOL-1]|uniref:class A sortase n=1 Tax=Listeria sp. PSOL-1 TaxID=1844999 RepID=UPI0013D40A77|nr:class A sortase [Listeria sp. PSOL-1]